MANLADLLAYTDDLLEAHRFKDYCPNGLQIEGKPVIRKLVSGVTASLALIEAAITAQADALLVHHGYFWRNEAPCLVGIKRQRVMHLLAQQINLIAYHLPLDAHPVYGNNAQLAEVLGFVVDGRFGPNDPAIGMHGHLQRPMQAADLAQQIGRQLNRVPMHIGENTKTINTIAWCSGAAQDYLHAAIDMGVDAFLTGEISEWCVHAARESGVHFFAAGHHATERYGISALGKHLAQHVGIEHEFIDVDNPV